LADAEARGLEKATVKKYRVLLDQLKDFSAARGLRFVHLLDLEVLRKFRESWADSNISAVKKLERLKSVCRFWCESGRMTGNHAKARAAICLPQNRRIRKTIGQERLR
jgi:site-specific recombinase XerC